MNKPRFVADSMLGSLAKWLRIMGFDTLYFKALADNDIIRIAKQQERVIITRDKALAKSKGTDCLLLKSNETNEQLKEILVWLGTRIPVSLETLLVRGRCAKCNGELEPTDKKSVVCDVPEHVFINFAYFFRCRDCGRVYWDGSHKKAICKTIRSLLKD